MLAASDSLKCFVGREFFGALGGGGSFAEDFQSFTLPCAKWLTEISTSTKTENRRKLVTVVTTIRALLENTVAAIQIAVMEQILSVILLSLPLFFSF
uniref:Uncharacterized protein n=1 Tax=Setaria digitata TaxID=48799 RepID=A0A915PQI1_9BILA